MNWVARPDQARKTRVAVSMLYVDYHSEQPVLGDNVHIYTHSNVDYFRTHCHVSPHMSRTFYIDPRSPDLSCIKASVSVLGLSSLTV